jgi:hypothetical protein
MANNQDFILANGLRTSGTITAPNFVGSLTGNSTTASTLSTAVTGDILIPSGSTLSTLSDSGVTAGAYSKVVVDAKGRVTSGSNPTTLAGYGITNAQPYSTDLIAIASTTLNGIARRTGAGTWTTGSSIALSSEVSGNLSVTNLNTGTDASSSTYWRGDGTWASLPSASTTGNTIQKIYSGSVQQTTGNTQINYNSNTPLITDGTQLWSKTLTPALATSSFIVEMSGMVDASSSTKLVTLAVFRGSKFISCVSVWVPNTDRPEIISLKIVDFPGSIATITYSMRIGISASSTSWYFGRGANGTFGGATPSAWSILEVS